MTTRDPNTPPNPDQLIQAFLDEGPTDLRDQVFDEVRTEIDRTEQRTTFGPWRSRYMNRFTGFAAVTMVIALAVVVGLTIGGGGPLIGGDPSQTPAASVPPEPSIVGELALPAEDCGELEEATYRTPLGDLSVSVTIPPISNEGTGWIGSASSDGFWLDNRGPCYFGGGSKVEVALIGRVYPGLCDRNGVETPTPAALTAALAAQTGHETSGPIDTTIGGYPASRFEFRVPDAADGTCADHDGYQLWQSADGHPGQQFNPSDTVTVWVVDVGGTALGVAAYRPDEGTDAAIASLRIEAAGAPSVEPSAEPSEQAPTDEFVCDLPITVASTSTDVAPLHLADVRIGVHDTDRIVFEYTGNETPELTIERAEPPFVHDPSGMPVEVNGSVVYLLNIVGASKYDTESGEQTYTGPTDFEPTATSFVVQLVESGDFEAVNNWYLGLNASGCFRAFTLTDPGRLVIDIAGRGQLTGS